MAASPNQGPMTRAPEVGYLFENVNPDLVRDKNHIRGLPNFWPFEEAIKHSLIYVKTHREIKSELGCSFYLTPSPREATLENYARHLVEMDGTGRTVSNKLIGLRSIGDTLKNPSFCLHDERKGHDTHLYCRVYLYGEIHVVVVDPNDLRVKTQFVFNNKNESALSKMYLIGTRGNWGR